MRVLRRLVPPLALLLPVPVLPAGSPAMGRAAFQALLQGFVDEAYGEGFLSLGDEDDFDHGHILSDADARPVAVLYHTQELVAGKAALDPRKRNWLQWVEGGRVERAERYKRSSYPATAAWDFFRAVELPGLESRRTILDKMLDPARVAVDVARTEQWEFRRVGCGAAAGALRVRLPGGKGVCLALSRD